MPNYPDFLKSTGFGLVEGLKGVNCRHSFGAAFDFTPLPYEPDELDKLKSKDKETTHYKWRDRLGRTHERDFTYRDALDRQRELERQQRESRSLLNAYKAAGSKEAYIEELGRYRHMETEYRVFSRSLGIDMQRERIQMDGLGRMLNWREEWGA